MKYKFISIIYNPLKYLFKNIILFIKLTSAIIAILSLFNVTIIYYNFYIMNDVTSYIIKIINFIKKILSKMFSNEEDDEIAEPKDFLSYRKDIKIVEKTIQTSNNSYWILPLMVIGYAAIYYYNPHSILTEIIEPIINKYDSKRNFVDPTIFVTGILTYKFITIAITYITGYDLNIFKGNDSPDNLNLEQNRFKDKNSYSPTDNLSPETTEDLETYFRKIDEKYDLNDLDTPKASTSKLPDIKSPPYIENPFNKIKLPQNLILQNKLKIEDWD